MKQKMKKVLSLVLSVALVVTGITITPPARTDVQAASSDGVFITDKIEPVGETSEDYSNLLYWKGQEIELSVAVLAQYQNAVTWQAMKSEGTESTADITLVGESSYTEYQGTGGSGYVVSQKFKISDNASGEYKIVAKANGVSKEYKFTVQDSYMLDISSTKFSAFNEKYRWTKDVVDLYVITKAGVDVTFTTDNTSLITIKNEDTCNSEKLYYYGVGSTVHKVTAYVADKINNEEQIDTATITATSSNGEAKTLSMNIAQSASKVVDSSISVTCNDGTHGEHKEITHINDTKDVIFLDSYVTGTEAKTIATLSFSVEGSVVDIVNPALDNGRKDLEIDLKTVEVDKENNLVNYTYTLSKMGSTPVNNPFNIDFVSTSTHMATKRLSFVIYTGNVTDGFKLLVDGAEIKSALAMDQGQTGKFSASLKDQKEKVVWEVDGGNGALTVNPSTGEYVANSGTGEATVRAIVCETGSGVRGQKLEFRVNVKQIVPPDKIEILNSNKDLATSTTLYVGDEPTVFYRNATKDGSTDGIYYPKYQNVLTDSKIVTLEENKQNNTITITPKKKGTTNLYIQTEDGNVSSQSVKLTIVAPIKTLTIQKDGKTIGSNDSVQVVEKREVEFTAVRDAEASDVEEIVWTATGTGTVKFLDDNNNECDEYVGNTCRVVTKKKGNVKITAKATGLDNRSKATTSTNMSIEERVPADNVSFYASETKADDKYIKQDANTKDTPYKINSGEERYFIIEGYSTGGATSNDEFTGVIEAAETGTTASWVNTKAGAAVNGGFKVKAGSKPGLVTLSFYNEQTRTTYKFYVEVVVPAKSLQIVDGNQKTFPTGLVLQENDECRLYTKIDPVNSTDTVSWYSSDSSVVSVSEQGDIKVEKYSETPVTITAETSSGVSATCEVYVVKPISSIAISAKDAVGNALKLDGTDVVYVNDSITASAVVLPEDATDKYNWTSTNPSVASVTTLDDGSCVITGKTQGKATINAIPRLVTTAGNVEKSFVITVATKPSGLDIKEVNNTAAASLTTTGVDIFNNNAKVLYAVLDPSNSQDYVTWTSEPADVLDMTVTNNGAIHSCSIKKVQSGKIVTLTATTSNGISKSVEVRTGTSLNECTITPIEDKAYDGIVYKPAVVVTDANGKVLTSGTDYTVTYPRDMTSAGTKEVIITGKGAYCDEVKVTCKIIPTSIAGGTVNINGGKNFTYTGEAITLIPTRSVAVSIPNGTAVKNLAASDYDVVCTNNINAGTATATITGKGNYAGTITKTFQIDGKDLTRFVTTVDATNLEYTGQEICPAVVVKDGTKELKVGVDYTLAYSDNVNVSTQTSKPTITITGIGNYTGTKTVNFAINAQTLTDETIKLSKTDYTYNGKNRKPKVTVYNSNGKKLKVDVDYTIAYPLDMANIGVKKITVTGKGNYKGIVNVEYGVAEKVSVKKASIKKVKNSKAKTVTFEVKKVSGAAGYEISYSTSKKFTKETTKVVTSKKTKKTIKKLTKGKTYYFKVRAYKVNSIGRKIYGKASSVKKVKIKK